MIYELLIDFSFQGDIMDNAFYEGDNSTVVPTDTCKNTVYCLAKLNNFKSIEEFGVIICKHFLTEHSNLVNRISVEIVKDDWQRIISPDTHGNMAPHKHTFTRIGPKKCYTKVVGEKRPQTFARYTIH